MTQAATESPTAIAERRMAGQLLEAALKLLGDNSSQIEAKLRELGWTPGSGKRGIEMFIRHFLRPDFSISGDRLHYISPNLEMYWLPLDSLPEPIQQFLDENP